MVGLQAQQALEPGSLTAPVSTSHTQLECDKPSRSTESEERALEIANATAMHLALSAAALESTIPTPSTELQKQISNSRIGAWVEGVTSSDMSYHAQSAESVRGHLHEDAAALSASLLAKANGDRSLRPNLSVVIPEDRTQRSRRKNNISQTKKEHVKPIITASSSDCSTDQSSLKSDGSEYSKKSSRTSVESLSREMTLSIPKIKVETPLRSAEAFKYRSGTYNPLRAGVFNGGPTANLNKPLPQAPLPIPGRLETQRSYASLSETKKTPAKRLVRVDSDFDGSQNPGSRPSSAQSWRPIRVRTSQSCRSLQVLDEFDNAFMKTYTYAPPVKDDESSTDEDSDGSEKRDKLCQIQPLRIRRKERRALDRSVSSESLSHSIQEESSLPEISVTRALTPSPDMIRPSLPRRSSKRGNSSEDELVLAELPGDTFHAVATAGKIIRLEIEFQTSNGFLQPVNDLATPRLPLLSPQLRFASPSTPSARISILIPGAADEINNDEIWSPHSPMKLQSARAAAETALLRIMISLSSLHDLMNTSIINTGMRRVYKENELPLLTAVLKNESPAAWELREWTTPLDLESPAADPELRPVCYTAFSYKSHVLRDRAVIKKLKPMIAVRCSGFLRPETFAALSSDKNPNAARFEEAFYRIWCFCAIFGSGKQREEDITGQLDWLKGGLVANQKACTATVTSNVQFDFNSVLLNPPEHFGYGNGDGLTADDLYDMTELWNCLTALLRDYVGKMDEARTHGVYNTSHIKAGDDDAEATALEEWIFHILSHGPAAVLKLAELSHDTNEGFALANINGWMKWTPPTESSRGTFMRDPLCRLYEQRIVAAEKRPVLSTEEQQRKAIRRTRVAAMAAEIRAARCSSKFKGLPFIDMAAERPMSVATRRSASVASEVTLINGGTVISSPTTACPTSPAASVMSSSAWLFSQPKHCGVWPIRTVSPVSEVLRKQSPDSESQHSRRGSDQSDTMTSAPQPSRIAVMNVVAMGFTPPQAREALWATHKEGGFHVDRAVDWLLRHK